MTKNQRKYNVGKFRQLIDLNGEAVNFQLSFNVKSIGDKPFQALIVDQDILDGDSGIDYKNSHNGVISGSIVADKNIHQSYSLLLRAEEDCECIVTTEIKNMPVLHPEKNSESFSDSTMFTPMQHSGPRPPQFNFREQPPPPPPRVQSSDRRMQLYKNPKLEPPRPQSRLLKSPNSIPTWMIIAIFCGVASLIAGYFA